MQARFPQLAHVTVLLPLLVCAWPSLGQRLLQSLLRRGVGPWDSQTFRMLPCPVPRLPLQALYRNEPCNDWKVNSKTQKEGRARVGVPGGSESRHSRRTPLPDTAANQFLWKGGSIVFGCKLNLVLWASVCRF